MIITVGVLAMLLTTFLSTYLFNRQLFRLTLAQAIQDPINLSAFNQNFVPTKSTTELTTAAPSTKKMRSEDISSTSANRSNLPSIPIGHMVQASSSTYTQEQIVVGQENIELSSHTIGLIETINKISVLSMIQSLPTLVYFIVLLLIFILQEQLQMFAWIWIYSLPLDSALSILCFYLQFRFNDAMYQQCCLCCDYSCKNFYVSIVKRKVRRHFDKEAMFTFDRN
ncbi:hypothetical protein RFI_15097 [Reticulomyxa filosa]|uniref:Uncharacterized protein n=1 Tax=Reticulomyxa filosa TaxID=46433 RepID=X6N7T3_RETFI|nr:hypothetical protein RFI_15097 [Reticulomyxa filosa]|eukprot:ETO22111.1 hypothetical protein RFI_15097 [Reticulomyxa filosa]